MTEAVVQHDVDVGDELHLHVEQAGSGPPLVLLHGFTGSGATWGPLRDVLGVQRTTWAVDLPGHGRSGTPADAARYGLGRFAEDLATMLDALGIRECDLLGYSLGGRAALHFTLAHRERVRSLVLESASPGIADPAERAAREVADRALAAEIEREGMEAFVDRWERLPLWESQASLPADVRAALRAERLGGTARGLANSLRGAGAGVEAPVSDRLASLAVPTLLVAGSLDAKYLALARQMAAALPAARVAIVEGAGHAVHLERPTAFAKVVAEFLATG